MINQGVSWGDFLPIQGEPGLVKTKKDFFQVLYAGAHPKEENISVVNAAIHTILILSLLGYFEDKSLAFALEMSLCPNLEFQLFGFLILCKSLAH
ncbi:hypothetical protein DSO57_1013253 [Entomophthora muscae]|uniref:Uncharacterized protein n=1 Tax=Entomophthora muscae TaxID=34485 RepID=A0ACC2SIJ1_9FUNG|nr:hypothetical protein DSO57_1013253 [Entomophthora muscae]